MTDIKEIVITSTSGYCPIDYAYEDKLSLTSDSIKYECHPYLETIAVEK